MPNSFSILVPIDFSEASKEALKRAAQLARHHNALMTLLHVETGLVPCYDEQLGVLEPNRMMQLMKIQAMVSNEDATFTLRNVVTYGDPATEILACARTNNTDLIVMGIKGRSAISSLLLGSVAETVLRQASCPVLLVKGAEEQRPAVDEDLESTLSHPSVKPREHLGK